MKTEEAYSANPNDLLGQSVTECRLIR